MTETAPAPKPQSERPLPPARGAGPEPKRQGAILVVEDEKNQRLLLTEELAEDGHTVQSVSNGEDALAAVARAMPDAVVLDIGLVGMNGIELLGKLLGINKLLPVVIYSAYASYRDDFMSWAADAFVLKSGDLTELKSTIQHVLARRPSAAGAPPAAT